jgi:hypothetical protein
MLALYLGQSPPEVSRNPLGISVEDFDSNFSLGSMTVKGVSGPRPFYQVAHGGDAVEWVTSI